MPSVPDDSNLAKQSKGLCGHEMQDPGSIATLAREL